MENLLSDPDLIRNLASAIMLQTHQPLQRAPTIDRLPAQPAIAAPLQPQVHAPMNPPIQPPQLPENIHPPHQAAQPTPPHPGQELVASLQAMYSRQNQIQRYRRSFEIISMLSNEIHDELKASPKFKSAADLKSLYLDMRRFFPEIPDYVSKPKALVTLSKILAE